MRKIKIFITILSLYELVMLTVLGVNDYCFAWFNINFCVGTFKYFLICIMLPILVGLFIWWMPEISRLFCKKCECQIQNDKPIKNMLSEIISKQDIEKFITAAIIMGIQKFAASHPKTTEIFDDIVNTVKKTHSKKQIN